MEDKNIIYGAAIAIICFGLGYFVSSQNKSVNSDNTFQAGWDAAKKRLQETGFAPVADPNADIRSLFGEVKEISGNRISLKASLPEPLSDPELDVRLISINENTEIVIRETKDSALFNKEIEEYNKLARESSEGINPPSSFNERKISISELKVGDQINVIADQNVRFAKEFTATSIEVMPVLQN